MTKLICINFHSCVPKIFHMVHMYLVSNNLTVFEKKTKFKFENRMTSGQDQRMTLTFDTRVALLNYLFQSIYQL